MLTNLLPISQPYCTIFLVDGKMSFVGDQLTPQHLYFYFDNDILQNIYKFVKTANK